jgi:hypothetical protein
VTTQASARTGAAPPAGQPFLSGDPTTVRLLVTDDEGKPMLRNRFNGRVWNPAGAAAGVTNPTRQDGTHALRHHYASVLLDAGESIMGW